MADKGQQLIDATINGKQSEVDRLLAEGLFVLVVAGVAIVWVLFVECLWNVCLEWRGQRHFFPFPPPLFYAFAPPLKCVQAGGASYLSLRLAS
jgi:hypothetical protein